MNTASVFNRRPLIQAGTKTGGFTVHDAALSTGLFAPVVQGRHQRWLPLARVL